MTDMPLPEDAATAAVSLLTEKVSELIESVDRESTVRAMETETLRNKQLTAARAMRRATIGMGVAVAAALIGAFVSTWLVMRSMHESDAREARDAAEARDRVAAAVTTCENSNVTRSAIDKRFYSFLDVLLASARQPATPEEAATRQAAVDQFRTKFASDESAKAFAPRDCSPAAVLAPAPLTSSTTAG